MGVSPEHKRLAGVIRAFSDRKMILGVLIIIEQIAQANGYIPID